MTLTSEQILKIMPTARSRVGMYIRYINEYADKFGINTNLRMSHFLAQIAHESAELRYTQEPASGKAYEGRKDLGNTHVGDGVRFKGRGLIQITGRANYEAYKKFCGFDVVARPELLEKPLGAVRSAMWFWQTHGLNSLADLDNIEKVTKRINGGYNGLESRRKYLNRAKVALST